VIFYCAEALLKLPLPLLFESNSSEVEVISYKMGRTFVPSSHNCALISSHVLCIDCINLLFLRKREWPDVHCFLPSKINSTMESTCTKNRKLPGFSPRFSALYYGVNLPQKRFFTTFLSLLLVAASFSADGQIAAWDFSTLPGGSGDYGPSPYSATTADANVTVVGLTRGAGVGTSGTGAANGWGGNDFEEGTNLANAISGENFATFSITANTGSALSLSEIAAYNIRRSGSGPLMGQWQYQVGNGTFVNIGSSITWGAVITAAGNPQSAIDLTGISDLQNVSAGTTVTFRVVTWSASSNAGTWYLNDPDDLPAADLTINGSIFSCVSPPSAGTPTTATACAGVGTVISGNPTGGSGGYSHLWTDLGTGTASGVSLLDETMENVTASAMSAGTINLQYQVTDNNGCTGSKAVTVTVNPSPTGSLTETDMSGNTNNDNIICEGGSATFTATFGFAHYDFRINGNSQQGGPSNVFVSPPSTLNDGDDVDVEVTDVLGCKAIFTTPTMAVNDLPVPMISAQSNVDCYANTTGSVTVTGGTMYSLNGGLYQVSGTFNGLSALAYIVTVKDANGCTADQAVMITEPAAALSAMTTSQTNVLCYGEATGSVTIDGADGTPGYTYSLDGGMYQMSGTFSGLAAGSYIVTVKDANDCTFDQAVMISEPDQLNAAVSPINIVSCFGANEGQIDITNATGGSGNYEYSIDGGSTWQGSGSFPALAAGTYDVRIRDAAQTTCVITLNGSLTITQPAILNANVASSDVTCFNSNDGSITITGATGGSGGYEYSIDGGGTWHGSGAFTGLAPATYDVKIRDAAHSSCEITLDGSLTITQPAILNANVASSDVTCFGANDGSITITGATGGSGSYQYSINGGFTYENSGAYINLLPGSYNIRLRDASNHFCFVILNNSLNISGPPVLNANVASSDVTCFGASDGSITITGATGGYGTYEYSIDGGSTWQGSGSFPALAAGTYDVRIRDAAQTTCVITLNGTLTITQPAILNANVSYSNAGCFGANNGVITVADATGGYGTYEYSIDGGGTWQGSGSFTGLAPATYHVKIRDAAHSSCEITLDGSLTITQPPMLNANVASSDVTCFGANDGSITITGATGGYGTYEYSIDGGSSWHGSGVFTGLAPATYDIRIRDAAIPSCTITLQGSLIITQPVLLNASVASTNATCFGASDGSITITGATGGYGTYEYSIDGGSTWHGSGSFPALAAGTYDVRIRDAAHINCSVTLNGTLTITQPVILNANVASSDVTCFGANDGTITLSTPSGGQGTYEYSIDGGASWQGSGSYTNLLPGSYDVRIRDAAYQTCVIFLNPALVITEPPLISVSPITGSNYVYVNNTTQLANATPLPMGWSAVWASSDPSASISNTGEVFGISIGSSIISYTVTDNNGCTNSATFVVNVSIPVVNIGVVNHVAPTPAGNKLKIQITPTLQVINGVYSNGVFTLRTLSSNGVGASMTVLNSTLFGGAGYTLSHTQLNDGGYDYYVFNYSNDNYPANVVNWASNTPVNLLTLGYNCAGNATFEIVASYTSPPYLNPSYPCMPTPCPQFVIAQGNFYQELNAGGAQNMISPATATSPASLNLSTTQIDEWCNSLGSIDLSVTNGSPSYTYDWSNDGPDAPDDDLQDVNNLTAGAYTVTVTDANGCSATNSTAILYLPVTNTTQNTHYATIQAAIDAANPVDNIDICAGTYYEALNVNKADLTLNGAGIDMTIVDHTGKSPASNAGIHVIANGVTVNNLTVTGNPANSVPRYGLKVGTSGYTTDDVVLEQIKVHNSFRTGFDIARAKDLTMTDIVAINNGGAGIFMTNTEGAILQNITTGNNPWTGVSVSTRGDWGGVSTGIVFSGTNTFGESAGKNGGLQLEMIPAKLISWSNDIGDGKDVTILPADFAFALSGPTVNAPYAPYVRFYTTLAQAETAAAGVGPNKPDHIEANNRYIRDADNSMGEPGTNFYVYDNVDNTMTIQAAINAAVAGNTINVYEGTFTENVVVNKSVTISGVGKDANPANNTVLSPASACSGIGLTISAPNVNINNLHITGYQDGISSTGVSNLTVDDINIINTCRYGIQLNGSNQDISITDSEISRSSIAANTVGIRVGTGTLVDGFLLEDCLISGWIQGMYIANESPGGMAFTDVLLKNSTISNNLQKGMYFEKLNDAVLEGLIMDNNGTDGTYGFNNGIDINLKYNAYSDITIKNCEITNSGVTGTATDPQNPAAIAIKARDDASSYHLNPASLSNVLIKNNKITGPRNGIRIGEFGKVNATPSNVTIEGNDLSHAFAHKALITRINQDVEVKCNWHGTDDLPTILASFASAGSGQINLNTVLSTGAGAGPGFVPSGSCVCPSGNLVTNSTTLATFCYIQDAIDAASDGQTLVVGPGTYVENIEVDKELTILGPNAAIDPCSGSRVAEAIVVPATAAIASGEIFHVAASNVTISGFNINGDNTSITSGFSSTNGADIDAREGITVYETGVNNLTVTNNIIENLSYFAVTLYDYPAGVPSTSHLIANNKIQNLGTYDAGSTIAFWGGGVLLYNNQYTDVTNNCMNNVRLGVQTGNFYQADPGSSAQITGNTMTNVRRTGVFHNLHYGSASPFTVSGNTITGSSYAGETKWNGVSLFSLSVPATAQGNIINASSVTQASSGIEVWNVKSVSPAVINGGSVTGVTTGVFVNNFDGYASNATDGAHATISGISINPVASGTGIRVYDNPSSTHANVQASIGAGVTINNGTQGLVVENVSASVPSLGNVAFTGQTGNYITLINNTNNINATTATFEGNTGAAATLAQNFAIEDKVLHKIDNAALGFVLVKANHDFVTVNSFSAPATTFALVQRGIDAASPGFTVNVNTGTYANAININKELKLYGLNSGISPVNGIRLPEATLATASGIMLNVTTTDPVEIKGFRLANAGGAYDFSVTGTLGTTITMEKNFFDNSIGVQLLNAVTTTLVDNLCTFSSGADEGFALFGNYNGSTGTHIDVHDNKWLNGQMTGLNLSNCEGSVYNNIFDNIAYYGILAANQSNLDIYQNEFTGIDNPDPMVTTWGAGVRFYDDAPGAIVNVHNNTFTGNYIGISVRPTYDFSGNTANVYDNSITGSTIANIRHEGTGTLPAECNWFGFTASAAVAATISGTVDYNPWRVSPTDTDLGTLGFQPTGPCVGTPVEIAVNVISPETCTGGTGNGSITTTTSNGVEPYMYLWSNASTDADATGLIGGTYTVTVTDANGSTAVTGGTVIALLVSNFTTNTDYATVQAAISAAAPGDVIQMCTKTFNERVVIDKSLTLEGKTSAKENYVLNGTGLGIGDGIHINDNVTGVTIRNLTVQNFTGANGNSDAAIYANAGNNMLTVDNVALLNNPTASGFYANGPISNVSITNSTLTDNGGSARGIVIWNGFKQNITITGNTLTNNTCCGIELQDGTASNVVVSNNTIDVGTGDNAIGLLGLNNSVGNNLIQGNIITGGGRFGIEIKNPNGGVTVSGNTVSLTVQDANPRDRAGIAVFRRDFTPGNPQGYTDIPNGVTISGNMVSGYTQPSSEEGFGIVVEGVSHSITGNTVTGSEVGIQIQGGGHANANYVANNAGSGNQDVGFSPNYFGRGNAPYVCDILESGNTLTNTINRRLVTAQGVFTDSDMLATAAINNQLAREVTLDNTLTQRVYCSIQAAINASVGNGLETVEVSSGAVQTSYNEQVLVNKDVTLTGVGLSKPIVDFTGTVSGKPTLFDISADGVVVDGFQFNTDLSKLSSAIIASAIGLDNITVQNNMIIPYKSNAPNYFAGGYGDRNAISINYSGSTNYRVAAGGVNNIVVDNNMVAATVDGNILGDTPGDIGFRAAVAVDEGAGTFTRNTFQTINHDILVRFNSNGPITVGGSALMANTFNGGGVTIAEHNAGGGAVDISHNTFDGSVTGNVLRLQNNQQLKSTTVSNNTFNNLRWGISLENYPAATIADNVFNPLDGYTTFRHITVNTKSISSNSNTIVQVPINGVITGNTFNSLSPVAGGTALAFYNHDSDNATLSANAFTVGTALNPNLFMEDFNYAIYLGDQTSLTLAALGAFPEYNLGAGSNTQMACWDLDIDIENNRFDVGAGLQLPKVMSGLQLTALESKLYHMTDNPCLGELIYFQPVMVNAKVFLQGPYDAAPVNPIMNDALRQLSPMLAPYDFPTIEPYSQYTPDVFPYYDAFVEVNNTSYEVITDPLTVLANNGVNSIVDWVFLELRNKLDNTQVLATRSALLQRDGDIVDVDGTSEVLFPNSYKDDYYLVVRHRNHLGAMTATAVDFTNDAMVVDFSDPLMATFGTSTTSARRLLEPNVYGLRAGNTNMKANDLNFQVLYNGDLNDRTPILTRIGFATPLNVVTGYYLEDVNLDGNVKYNGDFNDRVIILNNVGLATPLNVITQQPPN